MTQFEESIVRAMRAIAREEIARVFKERTMMIEQYEIRPYGKQLVRVWGAVVNGAPKVAAELPDNVLVACVSMTTEDARRFAQQILDACESAERCALGVEQSKAEAQRSAGLRTQPKPGEPGFHEPTKS